MNGNTCLISFANKNGKIFFTQHCTMNERMNERFFPQTNDEWNTIKIHWSVIFQKQMIANKQQIWNKSTRNYFHLCTWNMKISFTFFVVAVPFQLTVFLFISTHTRLYFALKFFLTVVFPTPLLWLLLLQLSILFIWIVWGERKKKKQNPKWDIRFVTLWRTLERIYEWNVAEYLHIVAIQQNGRK